MTKRLVAKRSIPLMTNSSFLLSLSPGVMTLGIQKLNTSLVSCAVLSVGGSAYCKAVLTSTLLVLEANWSAFTLSVMFRDSPLGKDGTDQVSWLPLLEKEAVISTEVAE